MKKSFTTRRRGSALLIVLGFLSFMMVSAVAFSVYMRIERQASSNYRHATTGRHMLNSALCRAIDEVDSELRVERVNTEGSARPRKFPSWPGRTKPSAVPNGLDNSAECRVLSQESLSFIPASLVNDVRRYAITNKEDRVTGVNAANNAYSYLGTKWRPLSMPVASLGSPSQDAPNAYEEAIVGRYAYLCVNVSDMLDVNTCRASARDAVTNRVSLGHLFGDNTDTRKKFDAYTESTAHRYETLQDFYACMYNNNDADGGTFGSPYHEYMNAGNSSDADSVFDDADLHVLVTDALAKAQPARRTACNILQQQPLAPAVLRAARPTPGDIVLQNVEIANRDGFLDALTAAFAGRLPGGADLVKTFPTCLADYLDEDSIPKQLNMPTVEMVPMVNQILVPDFFAPKIIRRTEPVPEASPPRNRTIYSVQLISAPEAAQMDVELVFPFKHIRDRTDKPAFKVEVKAFLRVVHSHEKLNNQNLFLMQPPVLPNYIPLTATVDAPDFWNRDTSDPDNCYDVAHVRFEVNQQAVTLDIIDNEGTLLTPGFEIGKAFSVALVAFARVKQGNNIVDSAPQWEPYPGFNLSEEEEFMTAPKLFFQTLPSSVPVQSDMSAAVDIPIPYEWASLEIPDSRFNYNAANWLRNDDRNAIVPRMNESTRNLLGQDGRDGDIFLAVSNAGQLNSPYELGFIVRPFKHNVLGAAVDFRTQLTADQAEDKDAMFRTVRLYDHGDPSDLFKRAADPLYLHFTAEHADGTVPGQRVNPLSTIPNVLWAAFDDTPLDYWYASRDITQPAQRKIMQDNTYTKKYGTADWNKLRNGWISCLTNTVAAARINEDWNKGLPQFYGSWQRFGWYSDGDATRVFNPQPAVPGVPVTVSKPLHEIDRKMLCGFSLDAFSDRQQLFLYFLRAEVTVPSFGTAQESGTRSLAGGRAVALVWRDPYPVGYDIENDNYPQSTWYPNNRRISPWYQVNLGRYNDDHEPYSTDNSLGGANGRSLGYHEHRVLFFKQLEN